MDLSPLMFHNAHFMKFGEPIFGSYVLTIIFIDVLFPLLMCDDLFIKKNYSD